MAKDIFGAGFLSPGDPTAPLYSATFLDQMRQQQAQQPQQQLEEQMRQAALAQIQLAVKNGNMTPEMAAQAQQSIAQQSTAYQQQQQQYQSQLPQFQAQVTQEQRAGMTPQQRAAMDQATATNARYGTDLSWLDPSFQYSPTLLGQSAGSQAAADPSAIAAQQAAMQLGGQYATSNLSFMAPDQQQAIMQQILGVQAPQFMSGAQQQSALNQLSGIAAPQFQGEGTERGVLNQALGLASNTGPGSLAFDTSGRQGEQYGNLKDIIAGGGADAIERAQRAAARADSESWLRGQREADMQQYAERGMAGSGMELQNLAMDRQAAAQRNSLADLQTSAALEQRKMDAINAASGLATNMRGQTIDEQGLLNNRSIAGLSAASGLASNMRSQDIQEQLGLNQALQAQAMGAGQLAGQMRGQTATEQLGLNQALMNQYGTAANLATTMRGQTANEQIANRNAQLSALGTLASTSGQARGQSAQEAQYRATAADDFAQLNQSAINNAANSNTQFLQTSYQQMMNNRQQWEQLMASLGVNTAQGLMGSDAYENRAQSNQASNIGMMDASQFNAAKSGLNSALLGANNQATQNQLQLQQQYNQIYPQIGAWTGDVAGTIGQMGINAASAGAGGSGGSLSTPGTTWAQSSGAASPTVAANAQTGGAGSFDWDAIAKKIQGG